MTYGARFIAPFAFLLAVMASSPGCGPSSGGGTGGQGGSARLCVPGQSIACVGVAACQGGQACNADGTGYGPCECGGGLGGSSSGGASGSAGGGGVSGGGGAAAGGPGTSTGGGAGGAKGGAGGAGSGGTGGVGGTAGGGAGGKGGGAGGAAGSGGAAGASGAGASGGAAGGVGGSGQGGAAGTGSVIDTSSPWATLHQCATFGGDPAFAVSYAPDGSLVAMGGIRPALYDPVTGALKYGLAGLDGIAVDVKVSPDGTLVAASANVNAPWEPAPLNVVVAWRTSDRGVAWSLPGSGSVNQIAFSPDGTLLALAGDDKTVELLNAATGAHVATYTGHQSYVTTVAFSPDGTLVASGDTSTVDVFRVSDQGTLWSFPTGSSGLTFTPDGADLFVNNGTPTEWDLTTGSKVTVPAGVNFPFLFVSGGQGYLAATGVYRTSDNGLYRAVPTGTSVAAAAASPDGSTLVLMPGKGAIPPTQPVAWSWSDGTIKTHFTGDPINATFGGVSPDGTRVVFGPKMYSLPSGARVTTYNGSPADHGGAFSPDGTLVAAANAGSILLQSAASGSVQKTFTGDPQQVTALAFSPDGTLLASGGQSDTTIKLWTVPGGALSMTLGGPTLSGPSGHMSPIYSITWSPDGGTIISTDQSGVGILWKASDGTIIRKISAKGQAPVSPDGQWLLSVPPVYTTGPGGVLIGTSQLSDMATGLVTRQFQGQRSVCTGAEAFSPDGTVVASGDTWSTMVWSTVDLGIVKAIPYPNYPGANWSTFTQDGLLLGINSNQSLIGLGNPANSVADLGWAAYWCR